MDLTSTTFELVSIPSRTGEEHAICDHLEDWARRTMGGEAVERRENNLLVRPARRGQRPLVGLFGHIDTVPPHEDQPLKVADGRVYGCGASDMKAGLTLMMAALEDRERHACDLYAVFYEGEEGPEAANGLRKLECDLPDMELAVVLEPTGNHVEAGCLGGFHATVAIEGRRAHSARPWQGHNALYRAIPLLERLRDRPRRAVEVEGLTFFEVMTATMARTTNAANMVPDRLEINVNVRFAPRRTGREALEELRELVGDLGTVEVRDIAAAGQVCLDAPLVRRWMDRCGLEASSKQAWTDLARLTARGVPAVNFGPGDPARAHQAVEWVEERALEGGHRLLWTLLGEVCREAN